MYFVSDLQLLRRGFSTGVLTVYRKSSVKPPASIEVTSSPHSVWMYGRFLLTEPPPSVSGVAPVLREAEQFVFFFIRFPCACHRVAPTVCILFSE